MWEDMNSGVGRCMLINLCTPIGIACLTPPLPYSKEEDSDEEDPARKRMTQKMEGAIVAEKPNVKWDDVAGLEGAKAALKEAVIMPIKFPQMFTGVWEGGWLFAGVRLFSGVWGGCLQVCGVAVYMCVGGCLQVCGVTVYRCRAIYRCVCGG